MEVMMNGGFVAGVGVWTVELAVRVYEDLW